MARYGLVLFDFDGTLYDTFPGVSENLRNTLRILERDPMPEGFEWRRTVGPPLEDIFHRLLGVPQDRTAEACLVYRDHYDAVAAPLCRLFEGMEDCLRRLSEAGIPMGIASSKSPRSIAETMGGDSVRGLFRVILGPSDRAPHLSKTDAILRAAEAVGVPAERTLMVGDTRYDAEGALRAGMDFCAVSWGYAADGDFDPWPCVLKADRPADIADYVLEL